MIESWDWENIYWTIALFATVLFILKLAIFMIVGGDAEVSSDFDSISEVDTSFNFLSIESVFAFFMAFGWCGWSSYIHLHLNQIVSLLIAIVMGLIFMTFAAYLMFSIRKLAKKVIVDYNELVNKTGKAYTSFEPQGEGKIEIILNEKLTILETINLSEEKIEAFSEIKVEKVENNKIYISRI